MGVNRKGGETVAKTLRQMTREQFQEEVARELGIDLNQTEPVVRHHTHQEPVKGPEPPEASSEA